MASLNFYMGQPNITSIQCLEWTDVDGRRDPQCLPIGGQSIWATAGTFRCRL